MARVHSKDAETDREEDYRDYEDRNIGDGWPYADDDKVSRSGNAPYGETTSNFDESGKVGAEIARKTAIDSHGGPELARTLEPGMIEDDALEEQINTILEDDERVDTSMLTISVHDGVATLSGEVDEEETRRLAETLVLSVNGVRGCTNDIVAIGADSHIPDDFTE